MSSFLYYRYNFISIVPTQPSISTSSFWSRSSTRHMWAKQEVRFDPRLMREDYLQTNAFSNLVVVKREEYPHALQRKATEKGVMSKVVKRQLAGRGQAWLLGRQHQLLPGRPSGPYIVISCGNNTRVEGLDVTLNDPAGLHGWVLMNGWMWVHDLLEDELRLGPLILQRK